jgi:transcription elongation factor GreA
MTIRGAQKLRAQLQELKTVERPRITKAIGEARLHHAAREQQSFIEGKIATIEHALAEAEIIDVTKINAEGNVVFGATVDLLNLNNDDNVTYQIVGEDEADINENLISITSPIARALISKQEGDVVEVNAPGGVIEYEILEVRYV